ncbi:Maf family protein [Marinomonas mediterranea]|jgi:MAF protein|uniref:7-methyl-GTP pyrophosphatase n=1 Tax=Marinomonas mediterranea (strain ATCC 700492 / JCM 21426 / NBRC 103028 / MMB-1) TaxID=717774 RepID=F2K3B0_MARM1|nr:Maf family protein [Marinomonas mediterranea]ADZ91252.1 Septum formation protein Maf [Marinomonas mediterranea MMB-1]WCN09225.1 septum formation protein Maf [Marinomonas mediterranea]WCN13307.1 septum formation protein Maf [Marinomonas mediterranea]WCN17375.1 septum formation protein Maf [Marinomonas mediterranea MMB-1]
MHPKIILGSSSPYRKTLLNRLKVPFSTHSPNIDETPKKQELIENYVLRMSEEKADAILQIYDTSNTLIITSDQSATLEENSHEDGLLTSKIIGKPLTKENAEKQLTSFSSRTVKFYTSVTITCCKTKQRSSKITTYSVQFKNLSSQEISRYLDIEKPFDCAGSFKCEGLGIRLFEKMEGDDPTSLEGLPLIATSELLCEFGADPLSYASD